MSGYRESNAQRCEGCNVVLTDGGHYDEYGRLVCKACLGRVDLQVGARRALASEAGGMSLRQTRGLVLLGCMGNMTALSALMFGLIALQSDAMGMAIGLIGFGIVILAAFYGSLYWLHRRRSKLEELPPEPPKPG